MPELFERKKRIVIFGTGSGGVNFFKNCGRHFKVIGFLDNNTQRQGQVLLGKRIYAPQAVKDLTFDKIIIASDYYKEIFPQLTETLNVDEQLIEVFHESSTQQSPTLARRLAKRWEAFGYEKMCAKPGLISNLMYRCFFRHADEQQIGNARRLPLRWLDEISEAKVDVLRPSEPGSVQGPKFINKSVAVTAIEIPEVALYLFRNAQVGSVSRSAILATGELVLERVPNTRVTNADYAGGHLLFSGTAQALVRNGATEPLEKGILISGGNEVNYYHWVVEVLPQLQFVAELPSQYDDYPILISKNSQSIPSIKALIDAMGLNRPMVFLSSVTSYQVAELLMLSAPNNLVANFKGATRNTAETTFARAESVNFLQKTGLKLARTVDPANLPKRVFLARKGFLRHYNQTEVLALLEPYGFTSVYMEEQDLEHQVAIMANAEVVIGPTGAAWTNIIFASAGTRALCWMAEEYGELSCFSNLAAIVGVDMDYLSYQVGTTDSRELYYRSYQVDPTLIDAWLKRHLPLTAPEVQP